MQNEEIRKVNLLGGDIFQFTEGLLVIPRSTSGTINSAFENGLYKLGIEYSLTDSELGELQFLWNPSKRYKDLHIVFATSVKNNSSDYATIARISNTLRDNVSVSERNIQNIYCPLLGAGAGNLEPYFCAVLLLIPFLKVNRGFKFSLVIFESNFFKALKLIQGFDQYTLIREFIGRAYGIISGDASIEDVLFSSDFYFSIAKGRLDDLMNFSISDNQKQKLVNRFSEFKGTFQEFLDSVNEPTEREFLAILGELVTYLDSRAYNKQSWNKYEDKRAVARAGVRQTDWIKNLLIYTVKKKLTDLPFNIKNSIAYLLDPINEFPILSKRDRKNFLETITEVEYSDNGFNQIASTYFLQIPGQRPVNDSNWTSIIARIIYTPLVKLVWDPDAIKQKTISQESSTEETFVNESSNKEYKTEGRNEAATNGAKTFKARLHRDRFADEDLLDYELYAQTIANFIKHEDTQPPLTIGIFAPWGMGKTTLMKFIERRLSNKETVQQQHTSEEARKSKFKKWLLQNWNTFLSLFGRMKATKVHDALKIRDVIEELKSPPYSKIHLKNYKYPAVWFNAWKYDNSEQVLSGLAYEIINQLVDRLPNEYEKERFYFNLNRSRFDEKRLITDVRRKVYGTILNPYVLSYSAVSAFLALLVWSLSLAPVWLIGSGWLMVLSIAKYLKEIAAEKSKHAAQYFGKYVHQPKYDEKLGHFHEIEADLKKIFKLMVDKENPCVIFIDDLDRCSSKKVVEVIESINLLINSDFPDCYFVIGMDAQMVAASIEAAYDDVNKRLSYLQHSHGSLGWYFLEKFVQLQFIIPNLNDQSSKAFIRSLFEGRKKEEESNEEPINKKVDVGELQKQVEILNLEDKKSVEEFTTKLSEVPDGYIKIVHGIKSKIIDRVSNEFKDSDDDITLLLENYSNYLSISPRVIKRFVNLFRFYHFMQIPNLTSRLSELRSDEIAQMVIISLRWPQLPRLIQWNTEVELVRGGNALERAMFIDQKIEGGWEIPEGKSSTKWLFENDLRDFLNKNSIKLKRYVELGVW